MPNKYKKMLFKLKHKMSDVLTWTEEKLELLFAKSKSQNYPGGG